MSHCYVDSFNKMLWEIIHLIVPQFTENILNSYASQRNVVGWNANLIFYLGGESKSIKLF